MTQPTPPRPHSPEAMAGAIGRTIHIGRTHKEWRALYLEFLASAAWAKKRALVGVRVMRVVKEVLFRVVVALLLICLMVTGVAAASFVLNVLV